MPHVFRLPTRTTSSPIYIFCLGFTPPARIPVTTRMTTYITYLRIGNLNLFHLYLLVGLCPAWDVWIQKHRGSSSNIPWCRTVSSPNASVCIRKTRPKPTVRLGAKHRSSILEIRRARSLSRTPSKPHLCQSVFLCLLDGWNAMEKMQKKNKCLE